MGSRQRAAVAELTLPTTAAAAARWRRDSFQENLNTAWESLLMVADGHETKRSKPGVGVERQKLTPIDLR